MSEDAGLRPVVLAIGAHPDDLEGTCCGTLAALARRGVEVHMATVTDGWCGSFHVPGEQIAEIRLEEARRAAEIAGATFHHLGMHDQGSEVTIERRRQLVDLMRRLNVSVLMAHASGDYHVDHRNAHELAFQARGAGPVPNFGSQPPLRRMPDLVFFDNEQGLGFDPHIWLDVTETIDLRRKMIRAHTSQLQLMRETYNEDLVEMTDRLARFRGGQRGCEYAEAFRGCGTYPNPDGGLRFLVKTLES